MNWQQTFALALFRIYGDTIRVEQHFWRRLLVQHRGGGRDAVRVHPQGLGLLGAHAATLEGKNRNVCKVVQQGLKASGNSNRGRLFGGCSEPRNISRRNPKRPKIVGKPKQTEKKYSIHSPKKNRKFLLLLSLSKPKIFTLGMLLSAQCFDTSAWMQIRPPPHPQTPHHSQHLSQTDR